MARRAPLPNLNLSDLARLADVADPDSPTSPGAVFLLSFYDSMIERHEAGESLERLSNSGAELAAMAAPSRAYDVFRVFADLAAWHNEDEFRREGVLDLTAWSTAEERTRVVLELIGDTLARVIIGRHIDSLCPNHETVDEAPAALESGVCWECEPWLAQYPPPAV